MDYGHGGIGGGILKGFAAQGYRERKKRGIHEPVILLSVIIIALLMVLMVRQFYVTGQFSPRYWSFFGRMTTWKFFLEGLLGTVKAAPMAAVITFCLGFMMMAGRISGNRIRNAIATALVEFTRGVPTLLFIYFFFLVVPQGNSL